MVQPEMNYVVNRVRAQLFIT